MGDTLLECLDMLTQQAFDRAERLLNLLATLRGSSAMKSPRSTLDHLNQIYLSAQQRSSIVITGDDDRQIGQLVDSILERPGLATLPASDYSVRKRLPVRIRYTWQHDDAKRNQPFTVKVSWYDEAYHHIFCNAILQHYTQSSDHEYRREIAHTVDTMFALDDDTVINRLLTATLAARQHWSTLFQRQQSTFSSIKEVQQYLSRTFAIKLHPPSRLPWPLISEVVVYIGQSALLKPGVDLLRLPSLLLPADSYINFLATELAQGGLHPDAQYLVALPMQHLWDVRAVTPSSISRTVKRIGLGRTAVVLVRDGDGVDQCQHEPAATDSVLLTVHDHRYRAAATVGEDGRDQWQALKLHCHHFQPQHLHHQLLAALRTASSPYHYDDLHRPSSPIFLRPMQLLTNVDRNLLRSYIQLICLSTRVQRLRRESQPEGLVDFVWHCHRYRHFVADIHPEMDRALEQVTESVASITSLFDAIRSST